MLNNNNLKNLCSSFSLDTDIFVSSLFSSDEQQTREIDSIKIKDGGDSTWDFTLLTSSNNSYFDLK